MTKAEQQVTPRQKAALFALAAGLMDWKEAYIAAHEGRTTEAREAAKQYANITHWKGRKRIQDYYAECVEMITRERTAQFLKGEESGLNKAGERMNENEREDSDRPDTKPRKQSAALIDYSDPTNRKRLINEVIRDASDDPKTRLDAAKVFEQQQRDDKQAAKDNQIQRFYTPVTCRECPIKAAFAEKRKRKADQAEK